MTQKIQSGGNPRYYQHYNLGMDPFPLDADNILYLTPELNFRLERIKEAIVGGNKIIVVTSAPGAGKSTFAEYLESLPESNWKMNMVQAESGMGREKLAHDIIRQALPDDAADATRAVALLHKYLELASRNNFVPVIIIDDADKLPVATLKFLLELATLRYAESLFRIVLFANESFTDKLDDPGLNNLAAGMIFNLHMPSLSRDQLREYIDTRLNAAGEVSDYPFDEDNLDTVFRLSAGLPAGINVAARQIMQTKAEPEPARAGYGKIAAGIAVAVTAGLLIYFYFLQQQAGVPADTKIVAVQSQMETAPPEPEPQQEPQEEMAVPVMATPSEVVPDELAQSDIGSEALEPYGIESDTDTEIATIPIVDIETPVINEIVEQQPEMADDEPVVDTTVKPVASAEPIVQTQAKPVSSYTSTGGENIYRLDNVPAALTGIRGNNWYRTQPRTAYVLQLISASELGNVLSLLEDVPGIQSDLSGYVKYTPSGMPRYLMFYGLYTDQDAAAAAVANLPADLQAVKPWPRSIGNITDEIDTVGPPAR